MVPLCNNAVLYLLIWLFVSDAGTDAAAAHWDFPFHRSTEKSTYEEEMKVSKRSSGGNVVSEEEDDITQTSSLVNPDGYANSLRNSTLEGAGEMENYEGQSVVRGRTNSIMKYKLGGVFVVVVVFIMAILMWLGFSGKFSSPPKKLPTTAEMTTAKTTTNVTPTAHAQPVVTTVLTVNGVNVSKETATLLDSFAKNETKFIDLRNGTTTGAPEGVDVDIGGDDGVMDEEIEEEDKDEEEKEEEETGTPAATNANCNTHAASVALFMHYFENVIVKNNMTVEVRNTENKNTYRKLNETYETLKDCEENGMEVTKIDEDNFEVKFAADACNKPWISNNCGS